MAAGFSQRSRRGIRLDTQRASALLRRNANPEEARMRSRRFLRLIIAGLALSSAAPAAAQTIKLGDINSYSGIGAPFTGPYRAGVEMAVEEINAKGGVLGRKLEVVFRDDKGQPPEAVKHAQELVESEKV